MPCNYSNYPGNWKTHIVPAIAARSGGKCEWCSVENYDEGYREKDGSFQSTHCEGEFAAAVVDGEKIIRIVLTVAHLDHDLSHNDGMATGGLALPIEQANLVHLCQKCHLNHDAPHRAATRRAKAQANQPELFPKWEHVGDARPCRLHP